MPPLYGVCGFMTDQQTPKGVVALVQSTVEKRKDRILLAATELFVGCDYPDPLESHVFAELFRAYIDTTPLEERRRIASLIARYPHAPHDTVLRLMRDEDASVAHRVIAYSPVLTHCDLVTAIGRGPEALRRAVVLRAELPADVLAALKLHAAPDTLASLSATPGDIASRSKAAAENETPTHIAATPANAATLDEPTTLDEPDARLSALLSEILADGTKASVTAAKSDVAARAPDVARELRLEKIPEQVTEEPRDLAPDLASEAIEYAETPVKADMPRHDTDANNNADQADNASMTDTSELIDDARLTAALMAPPAGELSFLYADNNERAQAIAAAQGRVMAEMAAGGASSARRALDVDTEMLRCLEQSAMARDRESFLGVLASMLDVDAVTAERITLDAGGEPLIVALAGLGMATSRTVSVMIQMSPAVNDIIRLRALSALRSNLDPRTALEIANQWRRTPVAPPARDQAEHQPLLDAAERPQRAAGIETAQPTQKRDKADVLVLRDVAN